MMNAISKTPIDILTWGNHEADIPHLTVCRHVRNFPGVWINSNMQDHDAMDHQVPYHIVEITSEDGTQTRKIGFVAVLSNDPKLYSQFKSPGAFGGATITDPWECLAKYDAILRNEHGCDLVVPLEHLYMHENEITCETMNFPLSISGHDHHRVDQTICGTRVIKAGMDGVAAAVIEIVWPDASSANPVILNSFVETASYSTCPELKEETDSAYDVLVPLQNTELVGILLQYRPLSSENTRGSVTTMGTLICSMLKAALNQTMGDIDAVILMGGNIRANHTYAEDSFFSMETLEAEIEADEVVGVVDIPGYVLAQGIEHTHAGDPNPGWFQYDDSIKEIDGKVVQVDNSPLIPDRMYRVVTKIKDLTNGQSEPLKEYFTNNSHALPSKGSYNNIHNELMSFFARSLFRKLWDATGVIIDDPDTVLEDDYCVPTPTIEEMGGRMRHALLDRDNDGIVTVDDIHWALREFLGLSVDDTVTTLADAIHGCADITGSGIVTVHDFEAFCTKMPSEYRISRKWSYAFPDAPADLIESESLQSAIRSSTSLKHFSGSDMSEMEDISPPEEEDGKVVDETIKRNDTESTVLSFFTSF